VTPASGEIKNEQQLYQNQIAKTMAKFLGITYTNEHKPGEPISTALK